MLKVKWKICGEFSVQIAVACTSTGASLMVCDYVEKAAFVLLLCSFEVEFIGLGL
jgi:hypothetical protein